MPMGLLCPSSNPITHFSQKVPTNADKRREAGEDITDCICEYVGMGGNECGGSRAYRIVILVLWAYGPSTRIIYARLYYRHPIQVLIGACRNVFTPETLPQAYLARARARFEALAPLW